MTVKRCPACQLVNPPESVYCDCGFRLLDLDQGAPEYQQAQVGNHSRGKWFFGIVELVLIPVAAIYLMRWWALLVLPVFYWLIRPALGMRLEGGTLILVVVDQAFTIGLAILAFVLGHPVVGGLLACYSVVNFGATLWLKV